MASAAPESASHKIRLTGAHSDEATEPSFAVQYPADARKLDVLQRNPLVPIGAGVTAVVLLGGLFAFNRGSRVWSQRMMRARILAQGATLGVLGVSVQQLRADGAAEGAAGAAAAE